MSETTSSPYVHLHPISPSSSLSSTDSAPHSEPTSDEQPDLGAFTTVLREWTHLQPPPRIPVQIRSATSSTTPTFQPEQSVIGSDFPSRSARSRISGRSGASTLSSFTRPPSSSVRPDGSTVWTHPPIASYLYSRTPITDEDEGEYTPSPPNSLASTALTVEITSELDFPSFDDGDGSHNSILDNPETSPYPQSTDILPVQLASESQRLDSREMAHPEDEIEIVDSTDDGGGDDSSVTSRDIVRPIFQERPSFSLSQSQSEVTSVQLQSQARPTTSSSSSLPFLTLSSGAVMPPTSTSASDVNGAMQSSPSTLINALVNRSRNPMPPRTMSDSSYTTTDSALSSNLSLLSYQIPETPPMTMHDEESEPERSTGSSALLASAVSVSLKTQRSVPSSSDSTTTYSTQRQRPVHASTASVSLTSSPLPNPHSPFPTPELEVSVVDTRRPSLGTGLRNLARDFGVVDDLGTPDQPPSEMLLFEPPRAARRLEFRPIDDDDEDGEVAEPTARASGFGFGYGEHPPSKTQTSEYSYEPSQSSTHQDRIARLEPQNEDEDDDYPSQYPSSHSQTPRYAHAHTPRGVPPPAEPRTQTMNTNTTSTSHPYSLQQQQQYGHSNHAFAAMPQSTLVVQHEPHPQSQLLSQPQSHPTLPAQTELLQIHASDRAQTQAQTQPQSQPRVQVEAQMQTQAQSKEHPTSSFPYTYANAAHPQSVPTYPPPPSSSSIITTYTQTLISTTHGHEYPHSLAGLHVLPTTLIVSRGSEDLPASSSGTTIRTSIHHDADADAQPGSGSDQHQHQPHVELESSADSEAAHPEHEHAGTVAAAVANHVLPSLGYLDEALSFIAAERARWNAAREGAAGGPDDSRESLGNGGAEGEGEMVEGEWRHVIDAEQDQPKRKRRRKRPPKSHAASQGASSGLEVPAAPLLPSASADGPIRSAQTTPGSSPKKKRRSKSASSSVRSLLLDKDGTKVPSRNKGKEKEFLIPPPPVPSLPSGSGGERDREKPAMSILKRPVEAQTKTKGQVLSEEGVVDVGVDSDDDGGKTPTNVGGLGDVGDGSSASPINLTGRKGRRVGRREREREKMRLDLMKEKFGAEDEDLEFGVQYDDDGADTQESDEEDEEGQGENDSISNMSLLQPPRRKRDRSRRRKARDMAYIHSVGGIGGGVYKSTPGTPRRLNLGDAQSVSYEMEEGVSVEGGSQGGDEEEEEEAEDVFASIPNEVVVNEKRKRSRPKRTKALAHARSYPQLRVDTEVGKNEAPPVEETVVQAEDVSSKKGKKKAVLAADGEDILEMDRNQLQQYLSATYNSNSGLLTNLRQDEMHNQAPPPLESKRGRLLALARQLQQLFPEQREELGRVVTRIERQGASQGTQGTKAKKAVGGGDAGGSDRSGVKSKRSRKDGHVRAASEGTTKEGFDFGENNLADGRGGQIPDIDMEEEEIDPRGRPPKKGDMLVHIFIDHSNILIGLLSHLKRNTPYRKGSKITGRGKPFPTALTKATTTAGGHDRSDPASAFAAVKSTSARPLPVPVDASTGSNVSLKRPQPVRVQQTGSHPIPLPSFATASRSLPTGSVLSTDMSAKKNGQSSEGIGAQREKEANSDGYEYPGTDDADADSVRYDSSLAGAWKVREKDRQKKPPKHLWHAALALILERGRPVTRRVVVTSSPLYQPMESIERLGYELRVFIRVPDFGNGMDRERYREKDKGTPRKSNGGGKSAQSSPVTTVSFTEPPSPAKKSSRQVMGHVRHISGSTSAESGSGAGSGNASGGGGSLHPYYGITNSGTPQMRVKYREQGVDELLQLKLHQALAATDDVPEGSTIVLATGDGNMGQFNEDGFLGPVRTALRRGWKVELYAWEDGLSRAWRREFGDGSEWGRRGMFRIIGMEQFGSGLVEAVDWA